MISTVTTSTVTTVALAGSFALIGILILFALLIQKELTTTVAGSRMKKLGQVLNLGIVPLFVAFIFIVVTKVVQMLR
jgi:hypothetical protein